MFAGIKRILGVDRLLEAGKKNEKPEWVREDGTIDKEQQEEVLKELEAQRALKMGKNKSGYKKSL
ncbi:MAG: hypothetical protein CDV28_13812 [Candidatus Electronema aureum]|uniref:Uncharacterized protein n=1 Tax=Candidatus Electronema aureum TaxID=2005002 RepID=A0A521FZE0_9BACT|nr:MAG: hypothetical protein CDV28_13812 [Candidatus Electronema aureum]